MEKIRASRASRTFIRALSIIAAASFVASCGGGGGGSAAPTTTSSATAPPTSTFGLRVYNGHLVDSTGNPVQLRGVNVSGLEFVAIQGWDPSDPFGGGPGGDASTFVPAIKTWQANAIRLPLNEASWLGTTTIDTSGSVHVSDPGGNYRATVAATIAAANAAGMYVIVDLHWAAPGISAPMLQTQMADADNSIAFWTSFADTYKNNPAVVFELYNEPYLYGVTSTSDQWKALMTGATLSYFPATGNTGIYQNVFIVSLGSASGTFVAGETVTSGAASAVVNHWEPASGRLFIQAASGGPLLTASPFTKGAQITGGTSNATGTIANPSVGWSLAGMQQMINAIRGTGATNVILVGGVSYNNDLSGWSANKPNDPLGQMGATWHPYPPAQFVGAVTVAAGGSGYAVNDTITLPQPNTVYSPAQFTVTGVDASGAVTAVNITQSGSYLQTSLPANPVAQASTSGKGSGASFNLTFYNLGSTWSLPANWPTVTAIVASGVPVVMTEIGEHDAAGTVGSPFLQQLLPWADSHGISYLGWTWDVWQNADDVLIKDAAGTPTDGYGVYYHQHLLDPSGP